MSEQRMVPDVQTGKVLIGVAGLVVLLTGALIHVAWRTEGLEVATPVTAGGTPLAPNLFGDPITTRQSLQKQWDDELTKGTFTIDDAMADMAGQSPSDGGGGGQ